MTASVPYLFVPIFSWPTAPGGKLHTYQAGGTTPIVTYEADGSTPNANPVVLDSNGTAIVKLANATTAYHFVLKDSTDTTTLWDADNYQASYLLTSGSVDSSIITYDQTAAELAASVTPVNYAYPSDQSLTRSIRYSNTNTWDYRHDQRLFELYLSKYGAVFNGSTDDSTAIQNAITAMYALGGRQRRVVCPSGNLTAKMTAQGLTFKHGMLDIDWNGLTLDFTSLASGFAFTEGGLGGTPYSAYAQGFCHRNLTALGSASGSTDFLSVNGSAGAGEVTGLVLIDSNINGFRDVVNFGAYEWNCVIKTCNLEAFSRRGIYFQGGTSAGEANWLDDVRIFNGISGSNSAIGIYLASGFSYNELRMKGGCLDYNDIQWSVVSGKLSISDAHVECNNVNVPVGQISNPTGTDFSTVRMRDCQISLTDASNTRQAIFTAAGGPKCKLAVTHSDLYNFGNTNAQLVNITDASLVETDFSDTSISAVSAYVLKSGNSTPYVQGPLNRLTNGDFGANSYSGWTQSPGSGYTLTIDSGTPHWGLYDAKMVSTGAGTGGSFYQTVPVRSGAFIAVDVWVNVTVTSAGDIGVILKYYQDAALTQQVGATQTVINYSAANSGYTESTYASTVPQGANFASIQCNGFSSWTGTAQFADLSVYCPG